MTPAEIDRVFGLGRQQMATGSHVEVFRERAQSGEERRYTKGFLVTANGDFRPWTEREWNVLERLGKHAGTPVARALAFLPGDEADPPRLQTRDAGATVEQWATSVPLRRGDVALRSVFEDCAHWWSLARHCLMALDAVHSLGFVHLDLKADNVCLPWAPAGAGRPVPGQPLAPRFKGVTLIDVAFSLLPEVDFVEPLPLLRQAGYEYQSPRLLHALEEGRRGHLAPTRALDWRCDFFSLAAMLWRYLPEPGDTPGHGWTAERHDQAGEFVRQLLDLHGAAVPSYWPHRELIGLAALRLREPELAAALQAGCTFDPERALPLGGEPTPQTRIAETPPRRVGTRREGEGVASAPAPLGNGAGKPTASAPAPLAGAPAGAGGGERDGPSDFAETAAADAFAEVPGDAAPIRPRPRGNAGARVALGVAVLAAAAAAWWFASDRTPPFEASPSDPFAERSMSPPSPQPSPSSPSSLASTTPLSPSTPPSPSSSSSSSVSSRAVGPAAETTVEAPASTRPSAVESAPTVAAPPVAALPTAPPLPPSEGLDALAAELMRDRLPRVAADAERQLARVLRLASGASEFRRRGAVRAAAQAVRAAAPQPAWAATVREQDARAFNDAALVAYGRSSDVDDASALQAKAFAANPLDAEVVGNLAFLRLKERPPQAEAARQLALHALTLNDARNPSGRIEDWTTLAIASALTGREAAARNAWYVSMALTSDLQHQCDAAVRAQSTYGDRLRPSVQAMLQRARSSAAYGRCEVADAPEPVRKRASGKSGKRADGKSGKRSRRAIP